MGTVGIRLCPGRGLRLFCLAYVCFIFLKRERQLGFQVERERLRMQRGRVL